MPILPGRHTCGIPLRIGNVTEIDVICCLLASSFPFTGAWILSNLWTNTQPTRSPSPAGTSPGGVGGLQVSEPCILESVRQGRVSLSSLNSGVL